MQSGVVILVCSVLLLGGCGFKDRPVAPQQVLPRPVTDLHHQLSEKGVTLFWSYPVETESGDELTEISEFVIYRAVVPIEDYCATCPIPFGPPITLDGGTLPHGRKKTARYQSSLLRPGSLYFFKVRSKSGWWAESKDSNIVKFMWNTPPLAPTGLTVTAGDKQNVLSWNPVTALIDGEKVSEKVRYQVLRSTGGGQLVPVGQLLDDTTFTDNAVENNRNYFYQVQTVSLYEEGKVAGGVSASVAATPLDKTPPAVPAGVRGVTTGVGIKIFWSPVADKDVKGYRVYRRLPGERIPQLAGEVLLPYNMFIDRNPPAGAAKMHYSVSSIDKMIPANESVRSPEVMVKN